MMTEHDDGIDEELYGGKPDESKPKSVDEQESESPTALIPKSILGGKKFEPGEEVVLKIVADHGEEMEVEYATEKPGEKEEPMKEKPAPDMDGELASMNSEY